MLNMSSIKLGPLPKVLIILGSWGIALLVGGILQMNMEKLDNILVMWGIVTVLGFLGHAFGLCKGLVPNYLAWVAVSVLGWAFTLFVFKIYTGENPALYNDVSPFWFAMMGIGFVATAVQVHKLFYIFAGISFLAALVLELSSRNIGLWQWEFLVNNQTLIFAILIGGGLLLSAVIGAVMSMRQVQTSTQTA